MIKNSQQQALPDIALCHIACFPKSLSTKLGKAYVIKTLQWFLVNPNRFLFHIVQDGKVAGYCGGFVPVKMGDGSSSGMLQFAFNEAVKGLLRNPFLLLHAEVRSQYKFIWLNIKRRLTGKSIPMQKAVGPVASPTHVGLVVIGVHPDFRGSGIAQQLMKEFEKRADAYNKKELILSVKTDNVIAIKAYKKAGWTVKQQQEKTFVMHKLL
jgi:ribosomal protein S18 acetylase RimI-like enzyme